MNTYISCLTLTMMICKNVKLQIKDSINKCGIISTIRVCSIIYKRSELILLWLLFVMKLVFLYVSSHFRQYYMLKHTIQWTITSDQCFGNVSTNATFPFYNQLWLHFQSSLCHVNWYPWKKPRYSENRTRDLFHSRTLIK